VGTTSRRERHEVVLVTDTGQAGSSLRGLGDELGGRTHRIIERPFFAPDSLDDLVDTVMSKCGSESRILYVGVRASATIGLALAISDFPCVGFVLHEPDLGPLAAGADQLAIGLLEQVKEAPESQAARLILEDRLADHSFKSATETESPLTDTTLLEPRRAMHACAELSVLAEFHPGADDLRSIEVPVLVTVGGQSPLARLGAAQQVCELIQCDGSVIASATGAPHLQNPKSFAGIIKAFAGQLGL
jgi:pimeloyl-ACP methyl ester carboxylesterase